MSPLSYAVALRGLWDWGTNNLCSQDYIASLCSDPFLLPTEEFQTLLKRLPSDRFLNSTAISQYWTMDSNLQHRYQQLGASLKVLLKKMHRIVRRLFNLCKRCHRQPRFRLPKERWARRLGACAQQLLALAAEARKDSVVNMEEQNVVTHSVILDLQTRLPYLSLPILSCVWS